MEYAVEYEIVVAGKIKKGDTIVIPDWYDDDIKNNVHKKGEKRERVVRHVLDCGDGRIGISNIVYIFYYENSRWGLSASRNKMIMRRLIQTKENNVFLKGVER